MMKERKHLSSGQKKAAAIAALLLLVLFFSFLAWCIGRPLVRFFSDPEAFRSWVDERGVLGRLAYIGLVFLQVIVAVIPGEPMEIGGGYAFGAFWGTVYCLIGAVAGSAAVFWFVRRIGVRGAEIFFPVEKLRSLRFLRRSAGRNFLYFVVFMLPGTPKDLLCYFAGLTDIGWGPWLLIASVGRLPSVISSTIGGSALGEKDYSLAAFVFVLTLCVSGAGLLLYRWILKRQNGKVSPFPEKKEEIR